MFPELQLDAGPTVGSWLQLADPALTEMMAGAGFDWLCIDLEHTSTSIAQAGELIPFPKLSAEDRQLAWESLVSKNLATYVESIDQFPTSRQNPELQSSHARCIEASA
jgi:hypothetical protein